MDKASIEITRRAGKIASRDGIPDVGSDEVRIHSPLEGDKYISTNLVMASFRTAKSTPIALMERLWADGERTHIVDRSAIVINLAAEEIVDAGLFFQDGAGDYTSIVSRLEIDMDRARKAINLEKRKKDDGFEERVATALERRAHHIDLLHRFERAGAALGVTLSSNLEHNRKLFRISPSSQLACYPAELRI